MVAAAASVAIIGGVAAISLAKLEKVQEEKSYEAMVTMANNQNQESGVLLMSKEEAKQLALQTAGLAEDAVKYLEVELELAEDRYPANRYIYQVEFTHDGLDYEFDIDGLAKTVLHSEVESVFE